MNDVLELDDRLGFLPELLERVALLQEGGRRLVALGPLLEQLVEVRDGLSAGDRVIVASLGELKAGATAVVRGEGAPAAGADAEVARR